MLISTFNLTSCDDEKISEYTVTCEGVDFTVNTENKTIFDGNDTYQYDVSAIGKTCDVDIIYPNGSTY